jgi:hypothetical protein
MFKLLQDSAGREEDQAVFLTLLYYFDGSVSAFGIGFDGIT